ncbi:P-loop containing nucleoside triphosphate hydrolase protein [Armillaria mellea]|nr:P-loop containing nucleoside triphosphate hydrolase protein [Armillaria mellea]
MSNDVLLKPRKDTIPIEDEAIPVVEPEKKKKKKKHSEGAVEEKKKKRKHSEDGDADSKSEKKKKAKHADVEEPQLAEAVDTSSKDSTKSKKEKKQKKSKSSEEPSPDQTLDSSSADKKEKKKKRKRDEASNENLEASEHPVEKKTKKATKAENTPTESEITTFLTTNNIACTPTITPYLTFAQLPVPDVLRAPLTQFPAPTPIQACAWPPALEGRDVVGIAETGSGKTFAFGIPALAKLISNPPNKDGVTTLIMAPTRELAMQTHDALEELGKPFGIGSVAVYGGAPKEAQIKMLRNAMRSKGNKVTTRIVVGTPGRILDLIGERVCELGGVDYLVLDEADRMLDQGFENAIRQIISYTKKNEERQTMMFSATWPESIRRLASTFQRDPVRVTVGSEDLTANSRVEQTAEVFDDERSKDTRLLKHLRIILPNKMPGTTHRVLVFALYKPEASRVAALLKREKYRVSELHGDMKQPARTAALEDFKTGRSNVLVATDVAARGLDIPDVGVVINYTFPLKVEDYVHRIGRTGRGGRTGKSITFFTGAAHEKSLAGEFARVLREGGYDNEELRSKFPMTIKKKEHSAYGAFFRDDIEMPVGRKKIVF